jgi:putative endonuclease
MAWYVYMLVCEDRSVYVGVSTNVEARYAKHVEAKGAKYRRSHRPIKLLRTWDCVSHSEALKLEHFFKRLTRAKKLYAAANGLLYEIPRSVPLIEP